MALPPKTKGELGLVKTPRTIQTPVPPRPVPEIRFAWTPLSVATTLTINGNVYPYDVNEPVVGAPDQADLRNTTVNTEITFTADVRTPEGDFIIEHEWDFGDGSKAYGEEVKHTYIVASPSMRVVLCVTDNHGRRFCRGQNLRLVAAQRTVVGGLGGGP